MIKLSHNKSIKVAIHNFNHCSTVCGLNNGSLLAWYSGKAECLDDQSVCILFINKDTQKQTNKIIKIGNKTGNPVLISNDNSIKLIYSKFEPCEEIKRLTDKWKYCSTWMQNISIINEEIKLTEKPICIAKSNKHYLGRCNPITYQNKMLLPLYDELNRKGVIVEVNENSISPIGEIGDHMIQPTLWEENEKLHSLSRNFGNYKSFSQYSYSKDGGKTWSKPISSSILNNNSSLHVIRYNKENFVIWNNTSGKYRRNMVIGKLTTKNGSPCAKPLQILNSDNGSYPSMHATKNKLITSFTSKRSIQYDEWTTG